MCATPTTQKSAMDSADLLQDSPLFQAIFLNSSLKKFNSYFIWRTVRDATHSIVSFLRTGGRHHLGVKDYFWDSRDFSLKALDLQQIVILSVISSILPVFFCFFILPLLACDSHLSGVEGLGASYRIRYWSSSDCLKYSGGQLWLLRVFRFICSNANYQENILSYATL